MTKNKKKKEKVYTSYDQYLREFLGIDTTPKVNFHDDPYEYGRQMADRTMKEVLKAFNESKKRLEKSSSIQKSKPITSKK